VPQALKALLVQLVLPDLLVPLEDLPVQLVLLVPRALPVVRRDLKAWQDLPGLPDPKVLLVLRDPLVRLAPMERPGQLGQLVVLRGPLAPLELWVLQAPLV